MNTNAFLYARSAVADAFQTTEAQLAACRTYAADHGYQVVAESTDIGSGLVMERPGLNVLLGYAQAGQMGVVVVKDQDRLARGAEGLLLAAQLEALGVRIETVTPPSTVTPESSELLTDIIARAIEGYEESARRIRANL